MCCFKLEKKNQVSLVEDSAVVHFTTNWFLLISQIPSEMVLQSTKPDLIHLLPMSYATYYLAQGQRSLVADWDLNGGTLPSEPKLLNNTLYYLSVRRLDSGT